MNKGYRSEVQSKNLGWMLPRPKPDMYKGGMPLYCEQWLVDLAMDILNKDEITLLNVFCGKNKLGVRVDINPEVGPDVCCDIHVLTDYIEGKFDVILADPPYSREENKQLYGYDMSLNYKTWAGACEKLLKFNGLFIIYHKLLMPNPNPHIFTLVKRVFIGIRVNHPPRIAIYFKKDHND